MRAMLRMKDGTVLRHGEHYDFPRYHALQRALFPVVSTVDPGDHQRTGLTQGRTLYGMGTAVCIGPGWYLTAKHVVEPYDLASAMTEDELMFVVLETDTALASGEDDVFGGMLHVRGYHRHSETDLATMTSEVTLAGAKEIRTLDLGLRMPEIGEPVMALGYPAMQAKGALSSSGPTSLEWERTLRASVGVVLERQPIRQGGWYRPGPGFVIDAPTYPGMSGGPVLDANNFVIGFVSSSMPPSDGSGWTSYIASCGPALELNVLDLSTGTAVDAEASPERMLGELAREGRVGCEMYSSCDVDPATGRVTYKV